MKKKYPIIYAFIDSQNLNLGTSKDTRNKKNKLIYKGWKLDFKKFRVYLSDKFHVAKAFLFIGHILQNEEMYKRLRSQGYEIIFKPTIKDYFGKAKGNIDAELVLHCAAYEYPKYDKAIVASGDGDFYCLYEYLEKKRKLLRIIIPNSKSESSLLRGFQKYKTFIEHEREKLEYKK
jgi:uncharacterized LabA/DUF88 family protein